MTIRAIEKPTPGSYSSGTLIESDILDAIEDMLPLRLITQTRRDIRDQSEWISASLGECFDYIDAHCPEGYYFGSCEGDGADFGVWPIPEWFASC